MSLSTVDNGIAYWDYLKRFEYRLTVRLGASHTAEYKQFDIWCQTHLGAKFKDWFITSNSKGTYTLYSRSNKWAMFLALTWVDKLV